MADFLTSAMSFFIGYWIWYFTQIFFLDSILIKPFSVDFRYIYVLLTVSVMTIISLELQRAYTYQRYKPFKCEIKAVLIAVILNACILTFSIFLFRLNNIPRSLFILIVISNFTLLLLDKICMTRVAAYLRKKGYARKNVLLVGSKKKVEKFITKVKSNSAWGLDIIGFLSGDKVYYNGNGEFHGVKLLGNYKDIESVLCSLPIDEVIVAFPFRSFDRISYVIKHCARQGKQIRIISDFMTNITKRIQGHIIFDLPIISLSQVSDNELQLILKRFMDILVSGIALVVLLPIFLLISLAIKLTSKGPILYKWKVIGKNGKPFTSWKFRTMVENADKMKKKLLKVNEMTGPVFKMKKDPRITTVGRFLRKFSLDELPQLVSVFRGNMSLVGPRPPLQTEFNGFNPWHRRKTSVKPGITCLWQICGRNKIKDFNHWINLDLEYIDNWSIWLDFKILLKTCPVVFFGTGE